MRGVASDGRPDVSTTCSDEAIISLDQGMKKRYHDVCKSTEDSLGAMLQASLTSLHGCSFKLCICTNDFLSEDELKHPTTMTSPLVPLDLHS